MGDPIGGRLGNLCPLDEGARILLIVKVFVLIPFSTCLHITGVAMGKLPVFPVRRRSHSTRATQIAGLQMAIAL